MVSILDIDQKDVPRHATLPDEQTGGEGLPERVILPLPHLELERSNDMIAYVEGTASGDPRVQLPSEPQQATSEAEGEGEQSERERAFH
jgi:hypothetical protein